jgi:hypothetical protein
MYFFKKYWRITQREYLCPQKVVIFYVQDINGSPRRPFSKYALPACKRGDTSIHELPKRCILGNSKQEKGLDDVLLSRLREVS